MCDCYTDRCRDCGAEVEMHLADFATRRDEIEVFCEAHMPADRSGGVTWRYRDSDREPWRKAFVRWLTDNARGNASGNHPNSTELESDMCPEGAMSVVDERAIS
jgi:hypothetical protein